MRKRSTTIDLMIHDLGTFAQVAPASPAGLRWLASRMPDGARFVGTTIAIDAARIEIVAAAAVRDGLAVTL